MVFWAVCLPLLRRANLDWLNAFSFLTPVFGFLIGVSWFNERLNATVAFGIVLSLVGVYLVTRPCAGALPDVRARGSALVAGEIDDLAIVLVLGSSLGWLCRRFNFANAVAQVLLGVVLGGAALGWVTHSEVLHVLGEVGVIALLGAAGLSLGTGRLREAGWEGVAVAVFGIVFSLVGGYVLGRLFYLDGPQALYIGLALAATSIGITVQVLQQFGLISHRIASVVIAAAVIDDVIVLYLLGTAHGFLQADFDAAGLVGYVALAATALGLTFAVCRMLSRWASRHGMFGRRPWLGAWIVTAIAAGAVLTDALALSAVVGAFFAGLGVGEGIEDEERDRGKAMLDPATLILMPFFFVMIGVQAPWAALLEPARALLVLSLVGVAVATKAVGGALGAGGKYGWRGRALIAFGMVPRGEVALVIATLGFEQGHVSHHSFVALILVTVVVSILGPLLMAPFARAFAGPA